MRPPWLALGEAGDVPEQRCSPPKDDLKIRPRHVGYAIGGVLKVMAKDDRGIASIPKATTK